VIHNGICMCDLIQDKVKSGCLSLWGSLCNTELVERGSFFFFSLSLSRYSPYARPTSHTDTRL
jgi:hypothetical protein